MAQRILVVDDDPNALRLISYALHREGFEVIAAQSGQEALALIGEKPVDLVVLDVMMPHMDGYEVCQRLRENPDTARLPVIMLTAKSQVEDKVRGFKAGADDYVTKPVLPAELVARVRALLVRSTYMREPVFSAKGKTLSFFGAKGGVGTTTLAVNVAIALAERNRSVVLADLNYMAGAVAQQLGLNTDHTILDLWQRGPQANEGRTARSYLLAHTSGIKVLPAPPRSKAALLQTQPATVEAIIKELAAQNDFLVVDAGSCIQPIGLAAASLSDRIILVTESDYLALDIVKETLDIFRKANRVGALIEVVMVNRTRSATVISRSEAEEYLKTKLAHFIIPAPEMCFQSNRNRIPLMISQPGNLTVEQIRELAEHLTARMG